jgi:uncharacterized membrane protein
MPDAETIFPTRPLPPSMPMTTAEFVNTMAHFHRAEILRMAGWRDRIDRTTNWSITVVAAMLSVSLSTAISHHGVLLFAMLLVFLLLWIEARRYRFFDVYRSRVRQFERHYFAQVFSPSADQALNWLSILGETLREPTFLVSQKSAFCRRLKRNYIYLFLILLLAWILKITTPELQADGSSRQFADSAREAISNATLGPLPGWMVVFAVLVFYVALAYFSLRRLEQSEEFSYGNAHV